MLPAAITGRGDIAVLASECEADLIAHYTRNTPDRRYTGLGSWPSGVVVGEPTPSEDNERQVYLRYYKADASDVSDSAADEVAFMAAMGRELASLIRHRASQRNEDGAPTPSVVSERRGMRSVTYAEGSTAFAIASYPKGFGRYLKPFDLRPKTYAV